MSRAALAVVALVVAVHLFASPAGEPWKNNDETRHVMTGVFVRDAISDWRESSAAPKRYALRYYAQYPALGLLVWPPLFYAVEGAAMSVFGTGYATARGVLTLFALAAALLVWRLLRRAIGSAESATLGLAVFLASPLVAEYSRFVLLEIPTLAFVLAAIAFFERHLARAGAANAFAACGFAACAALTRFDGVVILPYVLIRLAVLRRWPVLLRPEVVGAVACAVAVAGPYYWLTWREYGAGLGTAAASGTADFATGFLHRANVPIYLRFIPDQVGWAATELAFLGMVRHRRGWRGPVGVLWALAAATAITFVPLAEPEARHAIYWVPALAGFAALGVRTLADWFGRRVGVAAAFVLVLSTGWQAVWERGTCVTGYADAARYVVENRTTERPVLMDGVLNGGFIYAVREADPARKLTVLRGDKLLYAVLSDPHGGYQDFAPTEADVLARLHEADPEFVVVEEPLLFDLIIPAAERLRATLKRHPERFPLVCVVHFGGNHDEFARGRLEIYRKLDRNPAAGPPRAIPVLGLGRDLRAE